MRERMCFWIRPASTAVNFSMAADTWPMLARILASRSCADGCGHEHFPGGRGLQS